MLKIGVLASHPIQYQASWFRELAQQADTHVFFAHRASPQDQATAGFGVEFEWDQDLTEGYSHSFLNNIAKSPSVDVFSGCDTPEIMNIIKRQSFDVFIVNGWYLKSYLQAIYACWRSNTPVLLRGDSQLPARGRISRRLMRWLLYPSLFRMADGFLVVGRRFEEYVRHYGVTGDKLFFAPHSVDNDLFSRCAARITASQRRRLRMDCGYEEDDLVLLFVGKFIAKKRPLDILSVLHGLGQQGVRAGAVMVGDGDLKMTVRKQADKLKLRVHLAGFKNQSELPSYYVMADLLVLPSDAGETWGLVVNEGMACGLPALVSNQCGCAPDMIVPGKTGETFVMGDVQDMISKVLLLQDALQDMRCEAKKHVKKYSVQHSVEGALNAACGVVGKTD